MPLVCHPAEGLGGPLILRCVRIAVVTESFLPQVNGVTNSVVRVCEQFAARRIPALVVAPGTGPTSCAGVPVLRTPSVPLPGYASFRLGLPWPGLADALLAFRPDVVHLASPALLGAQAAFTARRLGLPSVAVYQTDLAGFVRRYGVAADRPTWAWLRAVHGAADLTLVPSRSAHEQLTSQGVPRLARWGRGVDLDLFRPDARSAAVRRRLAPDGELLVGYVGRLAPEKEVHLLTALRDVPGVRLVVVGDGPARGGLQRALPGVPFLGLLRGEELAMTFASLDAFVHTGSAETFCQTVQEALASGLPVVAPAAGGPLDLVQAQHNGLLFTPGSAQELRSAVTRLLDDPLLRARLAAAARPSVARRSWSALVDELLGHYAAVTAGRTAVAA